MRAPLATTVALAALALVAAWMTWEVQRERAESDFDVRAFEITERIRVRMESYEQVLLGGAALFAASDDVSREDWRAYTNSLRLDYGYPGFQGVGFSVRIPPGGLAEHVAAVRAEGFPQYDVYPAGARDEYHAIIYLEPFDWRNQRAFGYDMFSEPRRRAAMERARDTGHAALSAPLTLVQETDQDVQTGFNLYLPVYEGTPTDVAERRNALRGFVYSPFRMEDLLAGVLGAEPRFLRLEIRDAEADVTMYESSLPVADAAFTRSAPLTIAGRTWTLDFTAPAGFGNANDQRRPWIVLVIGLLISVLAGVIVWALASRRERGEVFSQVLQSAFDGVVIIDHDDRIIEINPAAERMFGYARDDIVGRTLVETIVPPSLRDAHLQGLNAYTRTGRGRLGGRSIETEAMRHDGTTFPVEIGITRIGSSEPPRFSGFIRDVSERRNRQEELLRLNAELERRVAERTRELEAFAYSVSHDLRGPLRAVDGFSAELERQYHAELGESGRHFVDRIRAGTHRMGQLIEDLLGLSRVVQSEMEASEVDLSALAHTVLDHLRAADPGRDVDARIAATAPVTGDPRLLRVLLENLLGNAWKFSSKAGHAVIEFGCVTEDGRKLYFVRDNGAGFDPAYADKLFVPFQRLHTDREFPGTGIGLATVQRVVHRHGGRIWAESGEGKGATFWFTVGDADG